jgi:hypothetical protein
MTVSVRDIKQAGMDEFAVTVFEEWVEKYVIGDEDLDSGDDYYIPIHADAKGTIVREVMCYVKTAFDVASQVLVGDATDPNRYLDAADVDPTSAGDFYASGGGANAGAQGHILTSPGNIVVAFNGNPTQGELWILVKLLRTEDSWRKTKADAVA